MAEERIYRVKLTPEQVLERIRSCVGQDPAVCPYQVRVIGPRFYLQESGFLAASLTGSVREEEGVACIDLRLSLHLVPTMLIVAFGVLAAQGLLHTLLDRRWVGFDGEASWEAVVGALGLAGISAGLLFVGWRPRRLRAAAYWKFLDQLFADVKLGEERL